MSKQQKELHEKVHVGIGGYIALVLAVLFFSGIFQDAEGPIAAFDFSNLCGAFGNLGTLTEGSGTLAENFRGTGGSGARDGFLFAITLLPPVMFALGVVKIVENYGGLRAAHDLDVFDVLERQLRPVYEREVERVEPLPVHYYHDALAAVLAESAHGKLRGKRAQPRVANVDARVPAQDVGDGDEAALFYRIGRYVLRAGGDVEYGVREAQGGHLVRVEGFDAALLRPDGVLRGVLGLREERGGN